MGQACQRVREARKRGRGYHYCIEIYVPKTCGSPSERKGLIDTEKTEALREVRAIVDSWLEPFNAVVRAYYV